MSLDALRRTTKGASPSSIWSTHPGTQLYFATVFEGDPLHNYTRDPLILDSELVRPVMLAGDTTDVHALVNFELVLKLL